MGVGLIPAAGGCKELVRRQVNPHVQAQNADPGPYLQQIFELIGFGKVSTLGRGGPPDGLSGAAWTAL